VYILFQAPRQEWAVRSIKVYCHTVNGSSTCSYHHYSMKHIIPTPSDIIPSSHKDSTASLYNISSIHLLLMFCLCKCAFVCAKCVLFLFCAKCAKYFCLCAMHLCFCAKCAVCICALIFFVAYLGASRCVTPLQEPAAPGLCHHLEGCS
jgi:hypothetical protein